jgi:hypothetical protein
MKMDSMMQCKSPHILLDYIWPFSHGMKQNGAGALGNSPNKALRNPILPVSFNTAER